MLLELDISGIAVIKRSEITFEPGFTVLTGETGAGKSIIIDSIGMLLGARTQKELIRAGENTATVSAVFGGFGEAEIAALREKGAEPDEDGQLYLRRDVNSDGKSTARINGRAVPLSVLRDAGGLLIDIHGQHDNKTLLDPSSHIALLDMYAFDGRNDGAPERYADAYEKLLAIRRELSSLTIDEAEKTRRAEMLQFQITDIDSAKLKPGEEETLAARRAKLRNLEKIARQSRLIYRALYRSEKGMSACELISRASAALSEISEFVPDSESFGERLESISAELEEIAERVNDIYDEDDSSDPTAELDKIETRLDMISKLKRKYGADIEAILAFRAKAAAELASLETADDRIKELQAGLISAERNASEAACRLSELRSAAAAELSAAVTAELAELEMPKAAFTVSVSRESVFTRHGLDAVEFMITANPGEPPKPLSKIASGGELSRVTLAIKSILSEGGAGTLIFDEIDTGVSGKTSYRLGVKLKKLASAAQVICVTHSAQIAAVADFNYFISKSEIDGRTETSVKLLDRQGRIREIARIMGGADITDKLLSSAEELLDSSG